MSRTITNHEMDRRKAIAALNSEITYALEKVSKDHGEFSYTELLFALSETMNRWAGHALREEWKEEKT